jgi:hypothetical protein
MVVRPDDVSGGIETRAWWSAVAACANEQESYVYCIVYDVFAANPAR